MNRRIIIAIFLMVFTATIVFGAFTAGQYRCKWPAVLPTTNLTIFGNTSEQRFAVAAGSAMDMAIVDYLKNPDALRANRSVYNYAYMHGITCDNFSIRFQSKGDMVTVGYRTNTSWYVGVRRATAADARMSRMILQWLGELQQDNE